MARKHVVPAPNGGWTVKTPNSSAVPSSHRTQSLAEQAAKRAIKQEGGGEVVIHRPDGRIRDSDTVAPGKDPNPPRDSQH